MSKQKGPVSVNTEEAKCSICSATLPWHFRSCVMTGDRLCPECQAIWPRHYPGCKRDVLKFSYWWIPLAAQKDLVEIYKAEKIAYENIHGRIQLPPPPESEPEQKISEPFLARKLALRLIGKILQMASTENKYTHDKLKYEVLEELEQIRKNQKDWSRSVPAGGRRL